MKSQLELDSTTDLQIEHAHQALVPKPIDSQRPRSKVVKFMRYKTKEDILKWTWAKRELNWQGKRTYIDHDYTPDTVRVRKKYMEAKKVLKANGITFSELQQRIEDIQLCIGSNERYGYQESASYCHKPARITDGASTTFKLGDSKQKDGT